MPETNENAPDQNRAVAKTTLTYTMIHPVELDPAKMNPNDVAYHLDEGEFVGSRTAIETQPLSDDQVEDELNAVGGSREFFKKVDDDILSNI